MSSKRSTDSSPMVASKTKEEVNENIVRFLNERVMPHYSHGELAKMMGLRRQTLQQWVHGRRACDMGFVVSVAELMGVSVGEVMGIPDRPEGKMMCEVTGWEESEKLARQERPDIEPHVWKILRTGTWCPTPERVTADDVVTLADAAAKVYFQR